MTNVTIIVPAEFKERMEAHPEINWSQVAREAFEEKIRDLETVKRLRDAEVMDRIAGRSELTEEDVAEIAAHVDAAMRDEFLGDDG